MDRSVALSAGVMSFLRNPNIVQIGKFSCILADQCTEITHLGRYTSIHVLLNRAKNGILHQIYTLPFENLDIEALYLMVVVVDGRCLRGDSVHWVRP